MWMWQRTKKSSADGDDTGDTTGSTSSTGDDRIGGDSAAGGEGEHVGGDSAAGGEGEHVTNPLQPPSERADPLHTRVPGDFLRVLIEFRKRKREEEAMSAPPCMRPTSKASPFRQLPTAKSRPTVSTWTE